jgi:hypothetical protein
VDDGTVPDRETGKGKKCEIKEWVTFSAPLDNTHLISVLYEDKHLKPELYKTTMRNWKFTKIDMSNQYFTAINM